MSNTNYWSRYWRQNVSRRRVLGTGGAITAGAAGLALVGCGDDDDDDDDNSGSDPTATSASSGGDPDPTEEPTGATGGGKEGGELVFVQGTGSDSLDPHTTLSRAFSYIGIYADKMISSGHHQLEPFEGELVESWEQVDETTLTLKVRPGVTYHGERTAGRAFTADDIAFNLMRIAGKLDPERSALFQRSATLANMNEAVAIDESTVEVTFDSANSQFLNGVADWKNWPVAMEDVEADPNFADLTGHSGTGPFMIDSFSSASGTGEYSRNPDYWKGPAFVDRVVQVDIPDPAASRAAFETGRTTSLRAQDESTRDVVENAGQLFSWEYLIWEYFRLNPLREPFTDPRVRRALFLALDPTELLNFNYGEGFWDFTGPLVAGLPGAWTHDVLAGMSGWSPDKREEDLAEARTLMQEATGTDGEISFTIVPSPATIVAWNNNAVVGKEILQRVWPNMEINIVGDDDANFFRNLASGDWDATTYAALPPPSALVDGANHYRTGGGRNYYQYTDPQADALFDQAFAEFDTDARNGLVDELQQRLLDDIHIIPLGKARESMGISANVGGFEDWDPGPGGAGPFDPVFGARFLYRNDL